MEKLERSLKKINKRLSGKHDFFQTPTKKSLFSDVSQVSGPSLEEHQTNSDISECEDIQSEVSSFSSNQIFDSVVGFSNLPLQVHRKLLKKVFCFNMMVVGQSGLGKSTLVNSMFLTNIYSEKYPGPSMRPAKTVSVESTSVLLTENSVNMNLTIVDTPGFGEALDNTDCWQPIANYIDKQYSDYLSVEVHIRQRDIIDNRIHCCLYFIQPTGHSLKTIDIEFMKHLHNKVNLIPVIGKADTLTSDELQQFKINILNQLEENSINIFNFSDEIDKENEETRLKYRALVPFAIVGSNCVYEQNGERKRGRKYPWGLVDIESLNHCDFKALRDLLIKHCMYDLIESTHSVHYEKYRTKHLSEVVPNIQSFIK